MAKVLFRDIRSGKRRAAVANIKSIVRQQLEQTVEREVKPALIKSHQLIVASWEHKPGFNSKKFFRPDKIEVSVFPTGKYKDIWFYVDKGTKPHPIRAKNVPRLKFQAGTYVPKTLAKPARTVSGGGYVKNPQWVSPVAVSHPGSEGRNFTKQIAEDIEPEFRRVIENAFRRAARMMEE